MSLSLGQKVRYQGTDFVVQAKAVGVNLYTLGTETFFGIDGAAYGVIADGVTSDEVEVIHA